MNDKTGKNTDKTKPFGDVFHSTTRYTRTAANFEKSKFEKTGLPDHCFKQKVPRVPKTAQYLRARDRTRDGPAAVERRTLGDALSVGIVLEVLF